MGAIWKNGRFHYVKKCCVCDTQKDVFLFGKKYYCGKHAKPIIEKRKLMVLAERGDYEESIRDNFRV